MIPRSLLRSCLLTLGCAGLAGCVYDEPPHHRRVYAEPAPVPAPEPEVVVVEPPPDRVEVMPAPRPGYFWIRGHYRREGRGYAWQPGYWERVPRRGAVYEPGRWEHGPRGYIWVEGRWR